MCSINRPSPYSVEAMCALPSCMICVPQNADRKCGPESGTVNSVRVGGSAAAGATT